MKRRYAPATSWIIVLSLLVSMSASLTFSQRAAAQKDRQSEVANQNEESDANYPALAKYTVDLTLQALKGKLEANRDREADVARVIESLSVAAKAPVVLGESDLDRDAIARGVALKIASGKVPDTLRGKRVFTL